MASRLGACVSQRTLLLYVALSTLLGVLVVQGQGLARADTVYTDTVTFPSGIDAGLAVSVIQLFLTIGASLIALVLGVKILPKIVKYVFKWIRMAVA